MSRGVQWSLGGLGVVVALGTLAGCSHYFLTQREPWRHDAEIACLNSGALIETPQRMRISAINGPGICGADYPLRVSSIGESSPLGYSDEPLRPPSAIPGASPPQRWPVSEPVASPRSSDPGFQSQPLPPLDPAAASPAAPPSPSARYTPQPGPPILLQPPDIADADEDDLASAPTPPPVYRPSPNSGRFAEPAYPPGPGPLPPRNEPPPLGPQRAPMVTGSVGPVEVKPAATLACPIVSALDQWITASVQPAALRWFGQPVVEIKQISAYSCRGMNGNPHAHISEHAFGNALDIAAFELADGRQVSVQYGWRGTPEEQGFLHDVQAAACDQFSTVLAPGANVYHYNHIHVDLMRRSSGRRICQPGAVPGEVVAERARARYAREHGDPGVTGSVSKKYRRALGYSGEDDDRLPLAVPGED